MDKDLLKQVQKVQLDILIEIDKVCKKYKIPYFLIGGSAIGAVRHKGFIPWDDDIDLGMLRKDYERFLEVWNEDLKSNLFMQNFRTQKDFPLLYTKIRKNNTSFIEESTVQLTNKIHQGIFVDIFPLDNVSDNKIIAKAHFQIVSSFISIASTHAGNFPASFIKKILKKNISKIVILTYGKKRLDNMADKFATIHKNKKTINVINFFGRHKFKEMVPRDFYNTGEIVTFEDKNFPIPKKWDEFLTHIYGDYMKLPAENDRELHNIIYASVNDDYKLYFQNNINENSRMK